MTQQQIEEKSLSLAEKFLATEVYRNAKTIYGYLPYNQEVRTCYILKQALLDGKRVAVPKVLGETMEFFYLEDLDRVEKSCCGIPEPLDDAPIARDKTALVLMPGLAFDKEGHRIGYGGGYYDKFLAQEPDHPTVALCYDFQLLSKVETEAHDALVDMVIWA